MSKFNLIKRIRKENARQHRMGDEKTTKGADALIKASLATPNQSLDVTPTENFSPMEFHLLVSKIKKICRKDYPAIRFFDVMEDWRFVMIYRPEAAQNKAAA